MFSFHMTVFPFILIIYVLSPSSPSNNPQAEDYYYSQLKDEVTDSEIVPKVTQPVSNRARNVS